MRSGDDGGQTVTLSSFFARSIKGVGDVFCSMGWSRMKRILFHKARFFLSYHGRKWSVRNSTYRTYLRDSKGTYRLTSQYSSALHHLLADAAVVSEQETAIHQPSGAPSIRTVRCTTLWLGLARDAALRTTPSLFRILHGEVLGTRDTPAASNTCSPLNTGCSIAAPLIPSVCPTETSLNEP